MLTYLLFIYSNTLNSSNSSDWFPLVFSGHKRYCYIKTLWFMFVPSSWRVLRTISENETSSCRWSKDIKVITSVDDFCMSCDCWGCKWYTHTARSIDYRHCSVQQNWSRRRIVPSSVFCCPAGMHAENLVFQTHRQKFQAARPHCSRHQPNTYSYYYIRPPRWRPRNAFNVWMCGWRNGKKQTHMQKRYNPNGSNSEI